MCYSFGSGGSESSVGVQWARAEHPRGPLGGRCVPVTNPYQERGAWQAVLELPEVGGGRGLMPSGQRHDSLMLRAGVVPHNPAHPWEASRTVTNVCELRGERDTPLSAADEAEERFH